MIFVDSHELRAFGADLGRLSVKTTGEMVTVFRAAGEDLKRTWAKNATETAGKHGKHYPKSITAEMKLSTRHRGRGWPGPVASSGRHVVRVRVGQSAAAPRRAEGHGHRDPEA